MEDEKDTEKTVDKFLDIIKEIQNFISEKPTCPIFHYTSAAGLSGILKTKTIFFTRWDFLNDSSENLHIHGIIEKCIEQFSDDKKFYTLIKNINKQIRDHKLGKSPDTHARQFTLYIASFSSNKDALNMWTYYTKSDASDGYCLEFSPDFLFKKHSDAVTIREVVYSPDKKKKIVNNLLSKAYNFYTELKSDPKKAKKVEQYIQSYIRIAADYVGCFFKNSAFAVEKEIRAALFLHTDIEESDIKPEHRISRGLIIPYAALPFEKEDVKSARISPTLSFREAHSGLMALQQILEYNFPVNKSRIPFRNI